MIVQRRLYHSVCRPAPEIQQESFLNVMHNLCTTLYSDFNGTQERIIKYIFYQETVKLQLNVK